MNNTKTRFNWSAVLATAPLGLLFAALTISGLLPDVTSTKWVALSLIVVIAVWIAVRVSNRRLLHGFLAGFLTALVAIWTQGLFADTYFANNPQYADLEMPFGWSPRLATFVLGPLNAILAGAIASVLAWLTGWVTRRSGSQ